MNGSEVSRQWAVSRRMASVQRPIVPEVAALIAACPGTISLGQGMVSYGPPEAARQRLVESLAEPSCAHYGPVPGDPRLLQAFAAKLARENGIDLADDLTLLVTAGSNMAFLQSLLAIADPGDEIVLLSPYYFNHEMAIRIAGCVPVVVATDEAFQPRLDSLRQALSPRTRAIVTVSPNNPTGAVYEVATLTAINDLCRQQGVFHISDEAYESFVWDDAEHLSPGSLEASREHTISLFSLSKAFGFAGWRIGFAVVPKALEGAMLKIQDTNLICATTVAQRAALGALEDLDAVAEYRQQHRHDLMAVREMVAEQLSELPGVAPPVLDGAFYAFLVLDCALSSARVNERLIRQFGVATLPGSTFGMTDRCALRVSYGALDRVSVAEGLGRLVHGLRRILDEG